MPAHIRASGSWDDLDSAAVRVASVWEGVDSIYVRQGGTWHEVWAAYTDITAAIDPGTYSDSVSNNTGPITEGFDALVTGGNGSPTYSWSLTSVTPAGTVAITSGASSASCIVEFDDGADLFRSATLNLTVDDGISSDSATASLSLTYGTPP